MFQLALAHPENPVIQLILAFRSAQKEYGTYKFIPWTTDEGKRGTETVPYIYGKNNSTSTHQQALCLKPSDVVVSPCT